MNLTILAVLLLNRHLMYQTNSAIERFSPLAEAFQKDVARLSDKQQAFDELHKDVVNLAAKQRSLHDKVQNLDTARVESATFQAAVKKQQQAILQAVDQLKLTPACPVAEPSPRSWWRFW